MLASNKKIYQRKLKITPEMKCYIRTYILKKTYFEYKILLKLINNKFKVSISKTSLYNTIKKLHITRKKIKRETVVKNKIKHNRDVRTFKKSIKDIPLNKIVSIDESHFNNEISAIYGWSQKGEEIREKLHIKKKVRYSLLCAVSNKKVVHYIVIKGSVNSEIFKQFIKELNVKLNVNSYFLLDNARIHHSKIVKEYMKTINHKLIFNAPYCPEYNPIEKVFSKVKNLVRMKSNNKDPNKLKKNIRVALNKLTKNNLHNYFKKSLEV